MSPSTKEFRNRPPETLERLGGYGERSLGAADAAASARRNSILVLAGVPKPRPLRASRRGCMSYAGIDAARAVHTLPDRVRTRVRGARWVA